jgi:DNA polymerase I-like protein with 3'-5' exonuclease and polymerase domains
LPGVKKLATGCKNKASERGYIMTEHGRHLRFPGKHKVYKASGILIQATSADINKEMWKLIDEMGLKLILNTHDSYGLSLPEGEDAKQIGMSLQNELAQRIPYLRVPLILELNGIGKNWWEALQ